MNNSKIICAIILNKSSMFYEFLQSAFENEIKENYPFLKSYFFTSKTEIETCNFLDEIKCVFVNPFSLKSSNLEFLLSVAPNVEWIHSFSAGVDVLLPIFDILKSKNITLTNSRGAYSSSLAEWAIFSSLYFIKDIKEFQNRQQLHIWDRPFTDQVKYKTMGFIGFGHISLTTARIAKTFEMKLIACRKSLKNDDEGLLDKVFLFNEGGLEKVLSESDIIVCTLPLTEETHHCLNYSKFSLMKKSSIFISIGRGAVIVEEDLIKILKEEKIKGAALDVFEVEPLPKDSLLWDLKNVLISSHNADNTPDFLMNSQNTFEKNLKAYSQGAPKSTPFITQVNLDIGY